MSQNLSSAVVVIGALRVKRSDSFAHFTYWSKRYDSVLQFGKFTYKDHAGSLSDGKKNYKLLYNSSLATSVSFFVHHTNNIHTIYEYNIYEYFR